MATEKAPVALTGAAGSEFEDCVAARFLIDLLQSRSSLGAECGAVVRVTWQARESGWLADDLVLACQRGDPATPTVNTGGGGWHYYLAIDGEFPCRTGLARGLDVKADGGYVVAPPSVHASGAPYAWVRGKGLDDLPLAAAPTWLLDAVRGTATKGRKAGRIATGARNNHLMSFAGRMRRDGAQQPRILSALAHENATTCDPPLDKAEVACIAASASRYPSGPGTISIAEILEKSGVAKLKGESLPAEREAVVERLTLAAVQLDRVRRALLREELIRRSGFSADLADAIVRQVAAEGTKQQGSAMLFKEVAPWDEPVDAALLLDEIVSTIDAFVVLPAHCSVAIVDSAYARVRCHTN